MGLFSGIKNTYKKSEAAVVVQNVLEDAKRIGVFDSDPAKVANKMIEAAWSSRPDVFDGSYGVRPHKVAVAAFSFAYAIANAPKPGVLRSTLFYPFSKLMIEIERNADFFPFNNIDNKLLSTAVSIHRDLIKEMESDPSGELTNQLEGILSKSGL